MTPEVPKVHFHARRCDDDPIVWKTSAPCDIGCGTAADNARTGKLRDRCAVHRVVVVGMDGKHRFQPVDPRPDSAASIRDGDGRSLRAPPRSDSGGEETVGEQRRRAVIDQQR